MNSKGLIQHFLLFLHTRLITHALFSTSIFSVPVSTSTMSLRCISAYFSGRLQETAWRSRVTISGGFSR